MTFVAERVIETYSQIVGPRSRRVAVEHQAPDNASERVKFQGEFSIALDESKMVESEFLALTATPRSGVMDRAVDVLARITEPSAMSLVAKHATDRSQPLLVRIAALRALSLMHAPDVSIRRAVIETVLTDTNSDVRDSAAQSLRILSDRQAIPALRAALASEKVGYVREAIEDALNELR